MRITVQSVSEVVEKSKGQNSWQEVTVEFRTGRGDNTRTLRDFADKAAFKFFTSNNFEGGEVVEVAVKKDGDYWKWTTAGFAKESDDNDGSEAEGQSKSNKFGGKKKIGDWETAEERGRKQVYIVRQSSVDTARALLLGTAIEPKAVTLDQVLKTAEAIENFVFRGLPVPTLSAAQDSGAKPVTKNPNVKRRKPDPDEDASDEVE